MIDKRILITGSKGYVGRNLIQTLICKGYTNIYGIDILPEDTEEYNYQVVEITDRQAVKEHITKIYPDVIIHLAANIRNSKVFEDIDSMIESNVLGTLNLIQAVYTCGLQIDTFVNLGTCEEYGGLMPPFDESNSLSPVSNYSMTKAMSTMMCKGMGTIYNLPIVTLRPSLIYGPNQNSRFFIQQLVSKLIDGESFDMTEGLQTRDFIFIDDVVDCIIAVSLGDNTITRGGIYNLCSGQSVTLREIVEQIKGLSSSGSEIRFGSLPYRENEIMDYRCNSTKIFEDYNWKAKTSLSEGLGKIIKAKLREK